MKPIDSIDQNQLLQQMRALRESSGLQSAAQQVELPTDKSDVQFGSMLKSAIDSVNSAQMASGAARDAFIRGEPGVNLAEVMVAGQKSSLSFQTLLHTRNQIVRAYEEIMRMPV